MRRALLAGVAFTLPAMLAACPAWAQEAAPAAEAAAPQDDEANSTGIQDIVVTARRREESLQRTPVSISAVSAGTLDRLNVQDITKVGQLVPNLILSPTGTISAVAPFIRGIGNQDPLLTLDSPVAVYLDGVYLGRQAANNFSLVELERVEVLRGPQGTLFGRNTSGGAVSIITKKPSDDFGIKAKASYGRFNDWTGRVSVNTGLLGESGIAMSFAYMHRQRDGYTNDPDVGSANDPGAQNSDSVWGRLHGQWGNVSLDVTGDYDQTTGQRPPFIITNVSPTVAAYYAQSPGLGGRPLLVYSKAYQKTVDLRDGNPADPGLPQKINTYGTAATLQVDVSDAVSLKSITSYRGFDADIGSEWSNGGMRGPVIDFGSGITSVQEVYPFASPYKISQHQVSQEFQLLGTSEHFKYVAGLYYFRESFHEFNPSTYTFVLSPTLALNGAGISEYTGSSTSYAAFAQGGYTPAFLDGRLEISAGARYTIDKKVVDVSTVANGHGERTFRRPDYNVTLNFQATPNILTYARVGSGYRSGGFNARSAGTATFGFEPEKATTYEGGIKFQTDDHRLRLNGSVFRTQYSDLQVAQFVGTSGSAQNADAHYTGFELELQAAPVDGLLLDGSVGYVDAKYDYFPHADPANPTQVIDIAAQSSFPYVAKWTTHVSAQYTLPATGIGAPMARIDYSHSSKRRFFANSIDNPFNEQIADPGQDRVSARIALTNIPFGDRLKGEVGLWGENLLNESLIDYGVDFGALGFAGVGFGQPRRIGIDFRLDY